MQTYSKTFNEKRLICFSVINKEECNYGQYCTYAHNLNEQVIDKDKLFMYRIVLDSKLNNYQESGKCVDVILRDLLFMTHVCKNCVKSNCTGGFNCRSGVCDPFLKLCKNDLLTGECVNSIINITPNHDIINKLVGDNFEPCTEYKGCINGHHLTSRGLQPYYKYIHQQENTRKNMYKSIRYINLDPISRLFRVKNSSCLNNISDESESTTDEEINDIFKTGFSDNKSLFYVLDEDNSDDDYPDYLNYH